VTTLKGPTVFLLSTCLAAACGNEASTEAEPDAESSGALDASAEGVDAVGPPPASCPEVPAPVSCPETAAPVVPTDVDQDGYTVEDGDCDDLNRTVYPTARERTGDGLDSNCDESERPIGVEVYTDALLVIDTDMDGQISYAEFEAQCAGSALAVGDARPGIVQMHVSCSGTNSCRGMVLHPWGELWEHDCRGVNGCEGWSCVEAAAGGELDVATLFDQATCSFCHAGNNGAFKVQIPPGNEDQEAFLAQFRARTDSQLRAAIAFGVQFINPDGVAVSAMPEFYGALSRAEMDALITYIRGRELVAHPYRFSYDPPVRD
jgi:hypothetical protein